MPEIGIGIVGGGYMGKAHSVAMAAVGAVFNTALRPRLEMICASSPESAERYRVAYGFQRCTDDWRILVNDPVVEAIVIASPQFDGALTERLDATHLMTGYYGLRPNVLAQLWVRMDVWEAHLRRHGRL